MIEVGIRDVPQGKIFRFPRGDVLYCIFERDRPNNPGSFIDCKVRDGKIITASDVRWPLTNYGVSQVVEMLDPEDIAQFLAADGIKNFRFRKFIARL